MTRKLVWWLVILSATNSPLLSQATRANKAAERVAASKAQAWAEAVTDFIANPKLGESFHEADVAQRLKALIPAASLKVDREEPNIGFGRNPEKGIAGIGYRLAGVPGSPDLSRFEGVSIYLPRVDPDGVDVLSRVTALMKRKLRQPWHVYRVPAPGNGSYWDHGLRSSAVRYTVRVDVDKSSPAEDGTPNEGPWVEVVFALEYRANGEDP